MAHYIEIKHTYTPRVIATKIISSLRYEGLKENEIKEVIKQMKTLVK